VNEISPTLVGNDGDLPDTTSVKAVPFTGYDLGWVILCIGFAVGAGILFMPIQMGIKGFWVSLTSIVIAYPVYFLISDMYLKSLSASKGCEGYADIVSEYLGKNWGAVLSVVYFLLILKAMLAYAAAITKDSASYLQTFGITQRSLADSPWYILALMAAVVLIASRGERLLFKVSAPMIVLKISIILFLAISMIPHWSIHNLQLDRAVAVLPFLRDVVLTIPFAIISIVFVQMLNPMNVAYRKIEADPKIATYRALRASRYAYFILTSVVVFFGFSVLLSITQADASYAIDNHISALALIANKIHADTVRALSVVLNIAAILTAFFGIYLAFHDAVKGLVLNAVDRYTTRSDAFNRMLPACIALGTILLLFGWVSLGMSAMLLLQMTVPVLAIVSCIVPCFLIRKVPALQRFRSPAVIIVFLFGVLLFVSPLLKLLEN
jgi:serine transporter